MIILVKSSFAYLQQKRKIWLDKNLKILHALQNWVRIAECVAWILWRGAHTNEVMRRDSAHCALLMPFGDKTQTSARVPHANGTKWNEINFGRSQMQPNANIYIHILNFIFELQ